MSKKSKKLIRAQANATPEDVATGATAASEVDAGEERTWTFTFLGDVEPEPVDEKALHTLMQQWRHGRASRTLGQVLGDAYFMIFSLVLIGAMVINLLLNSQHGAAGCNTTACQSGRTLLPWVLLAGTAALTLAAARIFGPVLASAAEGFWLMDAPVSRTRLLGGRLRSALGLAFGLAAVVAALVAALSGMTLLLGGAWTLAIALTAVAMIALAALEQTYERTAVLRVLQALFSVVAAAVVVWMVLVAASIVPLLTPAWMAEAPWVLAIVAGVVAVVCGVLAYRRLSQIRRARLLSGGSLVSGMQGAAFALDLGLARDILVERDAVARGHVKPTPGRGLGVQALIWRDLQRIARFPKPLLGLVAAALVPYAADALGLGSFMPFVTGLALLAAMVPFLGSMRVLSRTGGLARTMPFSTAEIRNATMVVPAVLALLWSVAVYPAVLGIAGGTSRTPLDALIVTVSIAAAGLLGAVRWQTAKQVDYSRPMMATNAGGIQPSLIFNLFRGIDVVVVVTAPLLLGAPIWVSPAIALVVYMLLRSGTSMEELQDEAKEQQKLAEAQRATASKEKIKVQRPTR
ncbi:DUF6297 family protein [Nigerium massiliense]|uniref:DUF6297 family protein n=1 Tax=Nigerium massiliense TaxID=1522317 RepID=UPI000693E258|nr:DUF6297 family protein [Nigerium massiliense]